MGDIKSLLGIDLFANGYGCSREQFDKIIGDRMPQKAFAIIRSEIKATAEFVVYDAMFYRKMMYNEELSPDTPWDSIEKKLRLFKGDEGKIRKWLEGVSKDPMVERNGFMLIESDEELKNCALLSGSLPRATWVFFVTKD